MARQRKAEKPLSETMMALFTGVYKWDSESLWVDSNQPSALFVVYSKQRWIRHIDRLDNTIVVMLSHITYHIVLHHIASPYYAVV